MVAKIWTIETLKEAAKQEENGIKQILIGRCWLSCGIFAGKSYWMFDQQEMSEDGVRVGLEMFYAQQ